MEQVSWVVQEKAEAIALKDSNTKLYQLLVYALGVRKLEASGQGGRRSVDEAQEKEQFKLIIQHQRDPLPYIKACIESNARCHNDPRRLGREAWLAALNLLLSAGSWAVAYSLASAMSYKNGWNAFGLAYLSKTAPSDRWPAVGGPSPLWDAIINCARDCRWCNSRFNDCNMWHRVYTYSFAVGGSEAALDIAEVAARRFTGNVRTTELTLLAQEFRRVGNVVKALRCEESVWKMLHPERERGLICYGRFIEPPPAPSLSLDGFVV